MFLAFVQSLKWEALDAIPLSHSTEATQKNAREKERPRFRFLPGQALELCLPLLEARQGRMTGSETRKTRNRLLDSTRVRRIGPTLGVDLAAIVFRNSCTLTLSETYGATQEQCPCTCFSGLWPIQSSRFGRPSPDKWPPQCCE